MSGRGTPPRDEGSPGRQDSPRTPRGGRLRDRVNFFEQVWTGGRGSPTSIDEPPNEVDSSRARIFRSSYVRPSSRASDSSFEESFERLVEEGDLNGAKVVKFEKVVVRKSAREIISSASINDPNVSTSDPLVFTEMSRTSSEEHALEDSAYQSHGAQSHGGSKSSSVTSFTKFPSEENFFQRRGSNSQQHFSPDDRPPSVWYAEYRNQSFQNVAARMEHLRSRSQYDAHIAQIKGIIDFFSLLSRRNTFLFFLRLVCTSYTRGYNVKDSSNSLCSRVLTIFLFYTNRIFL